MITLGRNIETGQPVTLDDEARARGTYVIGATGTGKTTLLQSIAYQDMMAGEGLCVLDPHGDMIDWLLARVPKAREKDVILFNPADEERPFGLNLLACDREDPKQVRWVVSTVLGTIRRLYEWSWGPRLEHVLSHTLWTAMAIDDSTLLEVLLLLTDEEYRTKVANRLEKGLLLNFWDEFPERQKERLEFVSSTVNKLTPFLLDAGMRNIIGQSRNTIDLRELMDEKKILLVNLSKGELGENNSALMGSVMINLILIAALSRRDKPVTWRQERPFHVIVDEYQNFASDSFSVLQSEARKYAVDLVVAHQFRDQLTLENRGSSLNVGNFISFRVTGTDGPELAAQFDNSPPPPDLVWEPLRISSLQFPGFYERGAVDHPVPGKPRLYSDVTLQRANELANMPPFQAGVRLIERQLDNRRQLRLTQAVIQTIDPDKEVADPLRLAVYGDEDKNKGAAERIRERSRGRARPRAEVIREIDERTFGHARLADAGDRPPTAPSEIVAAETANWLLQSELIKLTIGE